jgi:arginine repressor
MDEPMGERTIATVAQPLIGVWEKDDVKSDNEKQLFDMMEMSWVFAQAAKLLKTLTISLDQRTSMLKITTAAGAALVIINIINKISMLKLTISLNARTSMLRITTAAGAALIIVNIISIINITNIINMLLDLLLGRPSGQNPRSSTLDLKS